MTGTTVLLLNKYVGNVSTLYIAKKDKVGLEERKNYTVVPVSPCRTLKIVGGIPTWKRS